MKKMLFVLMLPLSLIAQNKIQLGLQPLPAIEVDSIVRVYDVLSKRSILDDEYYVDTITAQTDTAKKEETIIIPKL